MKKMNLKLLTAYLSLLTFILISPPKIMAATLIDEDFESWPPASWQIVDHNGNCSWTNHNAIHGWVNYIDKDKPIGEQGDVAVADGKYVNDRTNITLEIDTSLITPPLDFSDHSYIVLFFDTAYDDAWFCDDYADVDVSTNSGASWINLFHWENLKSSHGPYTNASPRVNLSVAAGCPNALVRFHYFTPEDYWWEIDDILIIADTIDPTEFEAEGVAKTQIDLSWVTNEIGDEVIIARNLADSFGTPADGTVYNVGNNIGSSSVIYKGNETGHSDSNFIFEATEYFYKIWSVNSKTQYSAGVSTTGASCAGTFPYLESFESGQGIWINVEDNDFDWKRQSSTTPSGLTGPDGGANGSSYYIYTEATPPGSPGKTFLIDGAFDFISSPNPELAFFYHMYGEFMGSLHVDVCDDSGNWHSNLWEISGEQQTSSSDPWKQATVEMQQFGGQSPVKIRFRGVTGAEYTSDMAVDFITITNRPGGMFFSPPSQSGSSNLGTIVKYNINALNLTGGGTDFNLIYTGFGGGGGWNETGPANTGFLNYRSSSNITVSVTIDPNAAAWETRTSIVTSVSTDGVFTNSAKIITKCDWNYDIYFEDFSVEAHLPNGWPNGWTNYFLGRTDNLGWFHGIDRYLLYWWPTHDPAYGATNWFVSPAFNFDTPANQLYLDFWFAHDANIPMEQSQNLYVSTGSRNPNDGDYVKVDDVDYQPGSAAWLYNLFDISAFHGYSNVYIAIDYTSGNPLIAFDDVGIHGSKTGVDNAKIDSPSSFTMDSYQSTPAITGSIFIAGSTGTSGPAAQVTAQFGYGFQNSNPLNNQDWSWVEAVYSGSDDTRDFFVSSPAFLSVAGDLDFAFRFKNGESTWIYADTDGSSNGYSKASAGKMTVNMLTPVGELIKEQTLPEEIIAAYSSVDSPTHNYTVADDFLFQVDTEISSIRWEGIYWGTGRTGFETGIALKVYANNSSGGDHPGSELYSELVPGYSCEQFIKEDVGFGINIFKYHIDLATPFTANKNTKYWFAVQMKTPVSSEFWGQLTTADPISGQNAAQFDGSSWGLISEDIGFELYGSVTNFGTLSGVVSRELDGQKLNNAIINVSDGIDTWTSSSGTNGEYLIDVPLGNYSVSAIARNYQTQTVSGINFITSGQINTQNFSLEGAELYYSPTSIFENARFGQVITNRVTLTNDGPIDANYFILATQGSSPATASLGGTLAPADFSPNTYKIQILAFEGEFEHSPASVLKAPGNSSTAVNSIPNSAKMSGRIDVDCFGVNIISDPCVFISLNTASPATPNIIGNLNLDSNDFVIGADYIPGEFDKILALTYYQRLIKITIASGAVELLGTISLPSGRVWTGLTVAQDGVIYASAAEAGVSYLYSVDLNPVSTSLIGTISGSALIIDIAINAAGNMYGVDIDNDNLLAIDKSTGAGTIVGSIGFDAQYAQGMDFDNVNDVLYYAAFEATLGGHLRVVDVASGNSTSIGQISGGSMEVDGFVIAEYPSANWVSLSDNLGTVPANDTLQIDVIFDAAAVTNFGTYTSELIFSGTHINSVPKMPLTMELLPSPIISAPMTQDFGSVDLFITSSVPLVVGNTGVGILTGAVQDIVSPFFISGETNFFIPASSNITLNTHFVSDVEGDFSQNVQLTGGGGKTVVFIGNAIPEPGLIWIIGLLVTRSILKMRRSG